MIGSDHFLLFIKLRKLAVLLFLVSSPYLLHAQFLTDMMDTTTNVGRGILQMYKKFDRIYFTGYLQPQFQVAQEKGVRSWNGGDFATHSNSRFMLRRGRVRLDYARMNTNDQISLYFVFQFDGTERGVVIRDFWGRIFENKWQVFQFTMGMFARPFGFEVNMSSADRETPERGRMSQILMRNERDLGAMISFEPRRDHPLRHLKVDAGFFNGQGLTATAEYDSYKDFITRASWKPYPLAKKLFISGGLSYFNGGLFQNTKYTYEIAHDVNGGRLFTIDSLDENIGRKAPRRYHGADMQLKWKHKYGATELRAEYWRGTQTASAGTSETPPALLQEPYYIRKFDGAFFYLLQNIVNSKHQLGIKYDWYDPNTKVKGEEIGKDGNNINATNIKYSTLNVGYNYIINENVRLMVWYEFVKNEKTSLTGYTGDIKDNVFTTRLQFRF